MKRGENGGLAPAPFRGSGPPVPTAATDLPRHQRRWRDVILDLVGRPPFATPPPLDLRVTQSHDDGFAVRHKVRYGGDADDVVWAWLFVPRDLAAPAPAVICLPGSFMTPNWGKDAPAGLAGPLVPGDPEAYGADLAGAGFVTLCPDHPCCGERTPPGCRSHDSAQLDARFPNWSRTGLSAWDVGRAVDVLRSREEVDEHRIGACGWSQGGQMAILGAALDERIAAVVSVCGWGPWRGVGGEGAVNWARSYNFPRLAPYLAGARPLPVDFDHIVACLAPRPVLDIRAEQDATFPNHAEAERAVDRLARLWTVAGAPERFASLRVEGGHAHGASAAAAQQAWLRRWLADDALA